MDFSLYSSICENVLNLQVSKRKPGSNLSIQVQRQPLSLIELFIDGVELWVEDLVHGKHMDLVGLEDSPESVVTENLPLVGWVLEVVRFDIFPYFLHGLGTGELGFAEERYEGFRETHWFLRFRVSHVVIADLVLIF
jgi:hypothetical protein